jgi:ribokinase
MLDWKPPKWIYYTSLGYGFEHFQSELVTYINEYPEIGVAFNPGSIQMKEGLDKMRDILKIADLLIVNKEEAIRLVGTASLENLHKKLHELGPKLTLITAGIDGSSAYDKEQLLTTGIYSDDRPLIDKTGAGDAFSSGFVSALIHKKPLEEALKWGAINSGNSIKEIGAINGLTSLAEMAKLVVEFPKS